jgi:hypothetical protein
VRLRNLPSQGPLCFLFYDGHRLNGAKQMGFLGGVFDIGFQQEAVHLRMDVLDGDLESVERSCFGNLNLLHETHAEVFVHDAIRGSEESKNVGNKVFFVLGQGLPVL